jgi:hypothetical protein
MRDFAKRLFGAWNCSQLAMGWASIACLVFGLPTLSTSSWGQSVTFSELDGTVIDATIVRQQWTRQEGRENSHVLQVDLKLVIGPDNRITMTTTSTSRGPWGARQGPTQTNSTVLEQVKEGSRGNTVWTFADGTLTFLRANTIAGAFRRDIAFAGSDKGLKCTARDTIVREKGAGNIVTFSVIDGHPSTILREKLISSTCRVTQRNPQRTSE